MIDCHNGPSSFIYAKKVSNLRAAWSFSTASSNYCVGAVSYLSLGGLIAVQFDNKYGIALRAYFPSFPVLPFVMKVRVHVWRTNKSRLNRVKECNVGLEKFAGYSACTNIRRSKIGCPFCDRGPEQAREGCAFPITLASASEGCRRAHIALIPIDPSILMHSAVNNMRYRSVEAFSLLKNIY